MRPTPQSARALELATLRRINHALAYARAHKIVVPAWARRVERVH